MVGALVVAAPASGNGKTTIATGLMAALTASGRRVAPFKVGPDFIDPTFHGLATGRPGRNLDPNLQGEARIAPLFAHGSRGADVAVVEGVMGLFDGRIGHRAPDGSSGFGSTAHVAGLLGAPVVLVVDARGYSQSLAALVRGYASFSPGVHVAGVILNQIGSPRHTRILTEACDEAGVPVLGAVPREAGLSVPSRHLGLLTPDADAAAAATALAAMGDIVAAHVDVERVAALASTHVECTPWEPGGSMDVEVEGAVAATSPVVAVADGPAFGFRYPEWDEMLAARGADVHFFDPRTDPLPEVAAALVLPGGYPEEHAAELEANADLRSTLRAAIARGLPTYAECGGLAYLGRRLEGRSMVGALDVDFVFGGRLHLGYRDAVALRDSVVLAAGERVTGHEFHRTHAEPHAPEDPGPALAWRGGAEGTTPLVDGAATPRLHASYLHLHPAGVPRVVSRLVAAARLTTLER